MAIREKRRRRLAILLGAVLLVILSGAGLWGWKMNERRNDARDAWVEGQAALEAGDDFVAMHAIGTYLGSFPDDVEANYLYARARRGVEEPDGRHLQEAAGRLRRVLELDPDHDKARHELLELYTRMRYGSEMLRVAEAILEREAGDVDAVRAKADALLQLGRHDEARQFAEACLDKDADAVRAEGLRIEVRLLGQDGKQDEALALAKQYNALRPSDLPMQLATLEMMDRQEVPADQILAHAEQFRGELGDSVHFDLIRGVAQRLAGNSEAATETLLAAAKREPSEREVVFALAGELEKLSLFQASLDVLVAAADEVDGLGYQRYVAHRLARAGRHEQIARRWAELDPSDPRTDSDLLGVRALALVHLDRRDEAKRLVRGLRERAEDTAAVHWAATLETIFLGSDPLPREVVEVCRQATQAVENNAFYHHWLGRGYGQLGENQLAVLAWRKAASLAPDWGDPLIDASGALLDLGQENEAITAGLLAARRRPESVPAALAFVRALSTRMEQFDAEQLREFSGMVEQIREALPESHVVTPVQVALLRRSGEAEKARDVVRRVLESGDELRPAVLRSLAGAIAPISDELRQACLDRLDEATAGADPDLAFRRAAERIGRGEADAAIRDLRARRDAAEPGRRAEWDVSIARALSLADDPEAGDAWKALLDRYADEASVLRTLVESGPVWADREFVDKVIDRLREQTGEEGLVWRIARARWLLDAEDDASRSEAVRMLEQVLQEAPRLIPPRALLAEAYRQTDQPTAAAEQLRRAVQLDPERQDLRLELVRVLGELDETSQVRLHLDRLVEQAADRQGGELTQIVSALVQFGEPDRAAGLLEQVEAPDVGQQLLLGRIYQVQGETDKAAAHYRELLADPSPAMVSDAVSFFGSQGLSEDASRALAKLDELDLPPGQRELLLAGHRARTGELDRARELLHQATQAAPESGQPWRARLSLEISSGNLGAAGDLLEQVGAAAEADPTLALLVEQPELLKDAAERPGLVPLVAAMLDNPEWTPAVREAIAASDADADAEAVRELARQYDQVPAVQVWAIRRLDQMNETDAALAVARQAMGRFPQASEPAELAARMLLSRGRWRQALSAAGDWRERLRGQTLPADLAIAEARFRMGAAEAALGQLRPHLDALGDAPEAQPQLAAAAGRVLLATGEADRAAELLRPLLDTGEMGRALWMQIGQEAAPDVSAATRWLGEVETALPGEADRERVLLAQAWWSLAERLRRPEPLAEVRRLLSPLVDQEEPSAEALLMAAVLEEATDHPEAAERAYRRVLEANPDQAQAANNLAMILIRAERDLDEAVSLARRVVELEPNVAAYRDTLGQALAAAERHDEAAAQFEQAIDLEPGSPQWYVALARVRLDAGDTAAADEVLDRVDRRFAGSAPLPEDLRERVKRLRRTQ